MSINAKDYGAVGNNIADDTAALQLAINTAYNMQTSLYIPAGNYLISSSLMMPFNSSSFYNQGNYIYGDGMLNTIIIANAPGIVVFNYIQPATLKFMLGGWIKDLSIHSNSNNNTCAISLQAVCQHKLNNLEISGFQDGIVIVNTSATGDGDACNHIAIENCLIQNCSYWGVFNSLVPGNNETSFLSFRDTTIQTCGTLSSSIGGGMYWRGQMLQFDNCAFVTNNNRGLYIEGGAGLGSNVLLNSVTFENNIGMNVQCYGIVTMEFNNLQMYNNDSFKAQYGIYLNGSSYLISQVRVNSAKIRATAANSPYVAFLSTGANAVVADIVVDSKQIRWDNWGYAGQTQYSGFTVV